MKRNRQWIVAAFSLLILGGFFLPWVNWAGHSLAGSAMPSGLFFETSATHFNLDNPFPGLNILFYLFWLIPAGAIASLLLAVSKKNTGLASAITGITALALVAVYILFGKTLVMLGAIQSVTGSLQIGIYLTAFAAIGLILAGMRVRPGWKIGLIILGPATAWLAFLIMEKKIAGQEYGDTADEQSAYTVWAPDLLREFNENDSLANAKYRDQILTVTGRISETEAPNDSTFNVKFVDSTGSYAIFPFVSPYLEKAKTLQPGDSVVIRASCSGGVYSDILETQIITFKRSALIQ